MTEIREATYDDLDYFVATAKKFLEVTGDGRYLNLDPESYKRQVAANIDSENCKCLVRTINGNTVGHCAMLLMPSFFDENQITAKIFTVWGKGSLKLVEKCEEYARSRGAAVIFADSHEKLRQLSVAKTYERSGYELSDQLYIKVL